MAYGLMPSQAASCPDAKQQYINGHFCYADKFAILTNGLGIIRHITFLDDDFKAAHPEMTVEKKSDSPDEDKSIGDATSLKPVLSDFFSLHPDFHPDTFLGDSSFDTIETYGMLLNEFHFSKALIPYNPRNESTLKKVGYNEYGYPTCPNDSSLAMKYCGVTHEKGRADRIKWICPKVHMVKGKYVCDCKNPCSTAVKGRTTYTYENLDFRMFPGIQRDSEEWDSVSAATNSTLYFPSYSLLKASTILYVTDSCSFGFATWMPNLITVAPLASFVVEFALSPVFPPHPASNPNAMVVTKTVDPILFKFFFFISVPPIKIR